MNVVSVFSGIGGLDAGLHRAGFQHLLLCEADGWRRGVLRERFPGVPVYDDVREVALTREAWNKGLSYTFAKRSEYANKGTWIAAMRRMYATACMRCGWDEGVTDTHHIVPKRDGGPMTLENGAILCPNCHRLADAGAISLEELQRLRAAAPVIGRRIGGEEVMPSEAPQIDLLCGGFPERVKTSQSQATGPDSPVIEADSSLRWPESSTLFDPDGYSQRTFLGSSVATAVGTSESCLERWPTSGTAWHGGLSTAVTSECRSDDGGCSSSEPSLTEILEPPQSVPGRYSLSARAATGILRRAEKRGRELPAHLRSALLLVAGSPADGGSGPTKQQEAS